MKTKLLKRLRNKFTIQERNGVYFVWDRKEKSYGFHYVDGLTYKQAVQIRREWILEEAKNYLKFKQRIK